MLLLPAVSEVNPDATRLTTTSASKATKKPKWTIANALCILSHSLPPAAFLLLVKSLLS